MVNQHATGGSKHLFSGGGEMGALMRSYDWSETAFGAVEQWPQSLRSALSICLNSRFPIAIYWGADCLLLYNDAWRPILGDKHPWSLGRPGREVWPEIWSNIGPEFEHVFTTGEGIFYSDELLAMHRFGYTEECFFDYTFNPIQGESGEVDGIFNVVSETTYRVLNERRALLLREIASRSGIAKTTEAAYTLMLEALRSDPADIPFALLYLIDQDGTSARLYGGTQLTLDDSIAPAIVDLEANNGLDEWLIAYSVRMAQPQVIHDLESRFGTLPGSPWADCPQEAMVLPIAVTGQPQISGVLVAVASPRRRLDDNYRDFFKQVAAQIASAIVNAQSYEQERQRAEQLAELDRAKTVFFSNVSHEFRTPLTLMLGPVEEALYEAQDPTQRDRLELIHRNALRLQKLVNTLLDFSRIEAGRIEAVYEPTDLALLTTDLAGIFRSAIEQAGIRLRVECPPLPEPIYVDREMWEKIVLNLLSNAFKFTFHGEIAVVLHFCKDHVELEVHDTGTGIPAVELPHIFERFHRVQGARGRTYEGSGIGLSLVQELVHLHGGTIHVSSVVDQGTSFILSIPTGSAHLPDDRLRASRTLTSTAVGATPYIEEALRWLPAERAEVSVLSAEVDERQALAARGQESFHPQSLSDGNVARTVLSAPSSSRARILLADDNADMRDYVTRLLSQQYDVEAVTDGLAAIAAIRQHSPDLVLTDVMMPGMDGFELLHTVRAAPETRELPMILLSARAGEESRIEGLEAGADDYLTKPFSARELLARVEACLKLARLRQEAAETLKRSEERYRAFVQQSSEGIWRFEVEAPISIALPEDEQIQSFYQHGYLAECNQIVAQMYGVDSPEALLGAKLADFLVPSDLRNQDYLRHFIRADYRLTDAESYEVDRQGNPKIFLNNLIGIVEEGKLVRAWGTQRDITARKQAEEQLRSREAELIDAQRLGNFGSWHWDAKTDVMTGSDQLLRIYGFDPATDPMPNFREQDGLLYPHESWERINQAVQHTLETGIGYELDVQAFRNGTPIWLTTRSEVLRDANGTIVGLHGTAQDITDRKQAELERERLLKAEQQARAIAEAAREEAQAANRVKDEFLAVLSHELRSPLNPILGWSKLLQRGKLDAVKTQQALETIERNAQLQAELIEDLLDVSRILQGKLSLNVSSINLTSILQAAMETVQLAAEAKSIKVEANLEPDVGLTAGDATRLQQVFWNLLSNAVKFTPEGGQVEIHLKRQGSCAQITISDTGQGIAPDFLPYVFDYFRQADATTTRKFGGLGLGLAIVRRLVELHGGTVGVESLGEGTGATFSVRLPLIATQAITYQNDPLLEPSSDLNGLQIMVVDDEPDSQEFVAFVLKQAGATVTTAATAKEAFTILMQSKPDVLLSDIGMPGMDGYMFMKQVRALSPKQGGQIPAIALTAYAAEIDYQKAMAAGFQQHISKPVEPTKLIQAIISLLK